MVTVSCVPLALLIRYDPARRQAWLPDFDGPNRRGILCFGLIGFPSLLAWQRLADRHPR